MPIQRRQEGVRHLAVVEHRTVTYRLSLAQAQHALDTFDLFAPRTGMYVRPSSWNMIEAFLLGYVASWPAGGFEAVTRYYADRCGESPIVWTVRAQEAHSPSADRGVDLGRLGSEQAANVLCAVLQEFIAATMQDGIDD
jgi:hypothetical protein